VVFHPEKPFAFFLQKEKKFYSKPRQFGFDKNIYCLAYIQTKLGENWNHILGKKCMTSQAFFKTVF